MATLETSLEAYYDDDRQAEGQKQRLIGERSTALPKNLKKIF